MVFVVVIGLHLVLRQGFHYLVQEVAGAGAVGGRYGPHLTEAKGVEIKGIVHLFAGVHLVHAQDHRFFAPAEEIGYLCVVVRDAGGGFAHEQHYIGLLDGDAHLTADGVLKDVVAIGGVTARVHHGEFAAAPFTFAIMPVAGYPGGFVHNGLTHAHQTVEQRGFSYVRSPDYRY